MRLGAAFGDVSVGGVAPLGFYLACGFKEPTATAKKN